MFTITAISIASLLLNPVHSSAVLPRQQAPADPPVGVYAAPGSNNFSCVPTPLTRNPVIFFHGLGANKDEDTNVLQTYLQNSGFCTYATTYGEYALFPYVGGLKPIADSAVELADFVRGVARRTGRGKVDIVGHSEGGFQALYVPKFGLTASEKQLGIVQRAVAIAPPTNGTTFGDLLNFSYIGGNLTRELVGDILTTVGCAACDDLGTDGDAVRRLNDGTPIKQSKTELTIVMSTHDRLVTPYETSRVNEDNVRNIVVQDTCPDDPVGHIGEAYDTWIWGMVANALDSTLPLRPCTKGQPY